MDVNPGIQTKINERGHIIFAVVFVAISTWLLCQIDEQTKWANGTKLFAQPRFWPAIGLAGMVTFGALYWSTLSRKRLASTDCIEVGLWMLAIEWVGWFLVYVKTVPIIGYLPTTVAFSYILTKRLGYNGRRWSHISIGFALSVVILFKTFMGVKIPGGAIYEYLPSALRSFFIVNF